MQNKFLTHAASAIFACALLVGCGKQESATTQEAAPAATPAAEQAPAAAPATEAAPTPAAPTAAAPTESAAAPAPAATSTAAAGDEGPGAKTYKTVCSLCHAAGIGGAPKFADKAAWEPRIKQGADILHEHALKGFSGSAGVMPPKGGRADLPDDDIKAAVDYMVSAAQ